MSSVDGRRIGSDMSPLPLQSKGDVSDPDVTEKNPNFWDFPFNKASFEQ